MANYAIEAREDIFPDVTRSRSQIGTIGTAAATVIGNIHDTTEKVW